MNHDHRSKYRTTDQYVCPACGKSWDVDDADVPDCITEQELGKRERKAVKGTHRLSKDTMRARMK